MVKLSEIAKESGFSIPVVSRVLSPKPHKGARVADSTRKHIKEVAKRLGYRPNRNAEFLKRGQNPVIGCFLPSRTDSLLARLMKGISEEAEKNNFPLSFYFDMTAKGYLEFIERSKETKNCGIITYPYFKQSAEAQKVVEEYQANGGKIVLIQGCNQRWEWDNCASVSIDDYHGGKIAAKHLLMKGAKLFFTQQYPEIPERISGFTDVVGKSEIFSSLEKLLQSTLEAVNKNKNVPLGIYVPRDPDAVTLVCELQKNNIKVGKEVLIVGYGDMYMTKFLRPALTTVAQPFEEIAGLAVKKLVAEIYGKKQISEFIKPELIIRDSA